MRLACLLERSFLRNRSVGPLYVLAIGFATGAIARFVAPRQAPRRYDVAMILAAIGAALGVLAYALTFDRWAAIVRFSPGIGVASLLGAMAFLAAFHILPRVAPGLLASLPGREDSVA
jgi:uncharacterized membrane protein YeaQ/YmgE (transglycosylase-associated protein family)